MKSFIIFHESSIRLFFFLSILSVMALYELWKPKRSLTAPKLNRWLNNLTIVSLNTLIIRLIFSTATVGVAYFVETNRWGFFSYYHLPFWITFIGSIILLDLAIYWQHRVMHAIPLLWRIHRVHHADLDIDVTTGIRFHPIEIVLSMLFKFFIILLFGIPVIAIIIFEITLNATSLFSHSNIQLPPPLDRLLRRVIVTPDMHRVHHSIDLSESNRNFGFNLSCWDRWFRTYQDQPHAGHQKMTIGIKDFRKIDDCVKLRGILSIPFKK